MRGGEGDGGEGERTSKEEMSWQERRNADRKEKQGEREEEVEVSGEQLTDALQLLYPLSSLLYPPIVMPGSVGAGEAS